MFRLLLLAFLACLPAHADEPATTEQTAHRPPVLVLEIRGAITPASAGYLHRGLVAAQSQNAALVVVELDTPGGLDTAMRAMVQDILASSVPIAVYVYPRGARAASAGTYLLYASHIAAMAPATNLGAATPVQIGLTPEPRIPADDKGQAPERSNTMARKQISDAAAYLRSLAQFRGRNADWGEQAVRESVSLSAEEALRLKVIDVIAADLPDLLKQIDGHKISTPGGMVVLATRAAHVERMPPNWRTRMLGIISNPSVALILMLVGIWGLIFEFTQPGLLFPGVTGAVCLTLAGFAFQMLPVDYAGLLLIVLGIGFMLAEAFIPSFGSLGVGGLVAFIIGALMLFDTGTSGLSVPIALIAGLALACALFIGLVAHLALGARRRPVSSGSAELVGQTGEIVSWQAGEGWLKVRGELWAATGDNVFTPGEVAKVIAAEGRVLRVRRM